MLSLFQKIKFTVFFLFFLYLTVFFPVFAQESLGNEKEVFHQGQEVLEGRVKRVKEEKEVEIMGKKQLYQKLEVLVGKGSLRGKTIVIENGDLPMTNLQRYKEGDRIKFVKAKNYQGKDFFYITDYVRRYTIFKLFVFFIVLVVLIARLRGLSSILGMAFSFLVIVKYIMPKILEGKNPVMTTITACVLIVPVIFYLSHGLNKKTTSAILGTVVSLFITGFLANLFVNFAKLTGYASEEASYLQVYMRGGLDVKGLVLAGIIIGALGVLDDITISQAAIVNQLVKASRNISIGELYKRAMEVGQDHIASMVNTLVLVYAGAAFPLFLLFLNKTQSFSQVIDFEIVAEEVVRTIVGSIGLILAVPITTFIAIVFLTERRSKT